MQKNLLFHKVAKEIARGYVPHLVLTDVKVVAKAAKEGAQEAAQPTAGMVADGVAKEGALVHVGETVLYLALPHVVIFAVEVVVVLVATVVYQPAVAAAKQVAAVDVRHTAKARAVVHAG